MKNRHLVAAAALVALLGALSSALPAQLTQKQLWERIERGVSLWDIEWKIDNRGRLRILPATFPPDPGPIPVEEWDFAFPPDVNGLNNAFHNLGLPGFLNLLLLGPRDIASLAAEEYNFRKLGLDVAPAALRLRAITPVTESNPYLRRRSELDRILAVRLLQQSDVLEALPELKVLAEDGNTDPFLRAAAEDVRLALVGTKRSATGITPELSMAIARVPQDADFIFFVDQREIPPAFFLPQLSRQIMSDIFKSHLLTERMPEDIVSPEELTQYQMITDFPSLLPYEIARRFGNLRLDWMLGALHVDSNNNVPFWLEGHGLFEVESIRVGLQNAGFQVEVEGDHITTDELPFGISMRLGREGLRVHRDGFISGPDDDHRTELLTAGVGGGEAIWIHAPVGSELLARLDLGPTKPLSATVTASFRDGIAVTLNTAHTHAASAGTLGGMLEGLRRQGIAQLQRLTTEEGESVSLARAIEILEGVEIKSEGTRLEVRMAFGALVPDDVAELMRTLGLLR